ncbi:cytochrome c oxidase assembly protein [Terrarubrum flagellatum]|uniref:cytochrome c oxidase assembly protein n=1 Tax=Terrirubrum flagellatum TaxID=2895980 RepID=UPI003145158B
MSGSLSSKPTNPAHRRTALLCAGFVACMVGLAYASVPLYNLFCRVTGFDGTPMVATKEAATTGSRAIRVRFDANVAPGLPWKFEPEEPQVDLKPGETKTILYKAASFSRAETMGTATFNVYPPVAAQYFNKLQCFCFNDTPLKAGESVEVPVVFFLDPALEKDPDMREVQTITLSYTFFATKNPRPVTAAASTQTLR